MWKTSLGPRTQQAVDFKRKGTRQIRARGQSIASALTPDGMLLIVLQHNGGMIIRYRVINANRDSRLQQSESHEKGRILM